MDIQSLRAFVAVADLASFSLAASRLHLTQPAVSKRIAVLESTLGNPLFDRSGRRPRLTQAGERLLPHARNILQAVRTAEQDVRDTADTVSGDLHLATSHHIGLHHLPPVLRAFSDQYPAVRLLIEFTDSEKGYDAVLRGELELAVITLAPEASARIEDHTLWPDPLSFVAAADHPLAKRRRLTLPQLSQYANVLPGLDTYTGQIVKRLFERHNLPLDTLIATNYLETIKMMVSVGLGWSVLPETLVDAELVKLPVTEPALTRRLGYIVHRKRALSNAALAFIELLRLSSAIRPPGAAERR